MSEDHRKPRRDILETTAKIFLSVASGKEYLDDITQDVGITKRKLIDHMNRLEKSGLILANRHEITKKLGVHNTRPVRYSLVEDSAIRVSKIVCLIFGMFDKEIHSHSDHEAVYSLMSSVWFKRIVYKIAESLDNKLGKVELKETQLLRKVKNEIITDFANSLGKHQVEHPKSKFSFYEHIANPICNRGLFREPFARILLSFADSAYVFFMWYLMVSGEEPIMPPKLQEKFSLKIVNNTIQYTIPEDKLEDAIINGETKRYTYDELVESILNVDDIVKAREVLKDKDEFSIITELMYMKYRDANSRYLIARLLMVASPKSAIIPDEFIPLYVFTESNNYPSLSSKYEHS